MYSDADVAALYDVMNPWDPGKYRSDAFYTDLVMAAGSVVDFGCGPGAMLHNARERGHDGRMAGLDPDPAMLDRARRRADIEWILAKADQATWDREFELATMASNAFQCLIRDGEIRASLRAIRRALVDGGQFAFETRNPDAQAWLDWNPSNAEDIVDHAGRKLRVWHEVDSVVDDLVTFTETTDDGTELRVDRTTLRFLSAKTLNGFLTEAGFEIETQHGDFIGGPVTATGKSIVTIARRA